MLIVLAVLALPLLVTAVFVTELAAGLPRARHHRFADVPGRVALVMPAHDEAAIIGRTLADLRAATEGWAEVLVVADNCTDETAAIARAAGVEVLERNDPANRGKGFALAFARDHLRADPPDAVIVFDADCWSDRSSLRCLAALALALGRPCQAISLIATARGAPPMVQLSNFAFMIKNRVRQLGLQRLTGRVHLVGTGMGFPWPIFAAAPLATASIVEDVELGRALGDAGLEPQLAPHSTVWSASSSATGTLVQRTRWEGGFLSFARAHLPRAFALVFRGGGVRALVTALDLAVPPLTLLALGDAAALAGGALLTWLLGAPWWPVVLMVVLTALANGLVLLAWLREGRAFISAGALARIPFYILWKIPLYLGLLRGRPREWLRSGR